VHLPQVLVDTDVEPLAFPFLISLCQLLLVCRF
jgi:hypothetical protein